MERANRGKFDGMHAILIRCVDVEVFPKIISFFFSIPEEVFEGCE